MDSRLLPCSMVVSLFCIAVGAAGVAGDIRATEPAADDPTKVEFFEKLYKTEIRGVKLLEDYEDPDSFYSAIAQQVGIPEIAFEALRKRFGWKPGDGFAYSAVVKGGSTSANWGVMVSRIPEPKQKPKTGEEMRFLLKQMELKFVVVGYDGTISFPQEDNEAKPQKNEDSGPAVKTKPEPGT